MRERDEITSPNEHEKQPTAVATAAVVDLLPGAQLAKRFVVRRRLGSGATGTVFEALDTVVGQRVAVKLLRPEVSDHASRERLRREVRTARPGHPSLVTVFELHEHGGRPLLSMELVEGGSLRDALSNASVLPWNEVVGIGRQVASALAHLHSKGLVHRDVKPGNILIAPDGTAKLCDMGLARPADRGSTVTETAMVVGTPAFMAPEQATSHNLTSASDIYSLGLTLARALTGSVPLEADTAIESLMLRQKARPPRIRNAATTCPRWLDRLLRRMLEPDPRDRPSASQVEHALKHGVFGPLPSSRTIRRVAWATLSVIAIAAAAAAFLHLRTTAVLDPESALQFNVRQAVQSSTAEISDLDGNLLLEVDLGGAWDPDDYGTLGDHRVAFGDLNGDGLQDAAVSKVTDPANLPLILCLRQTDGTLEIADRRSTNLSFTYEQKAFTDFRSRDLITADLTGDGRHEIVTVLASSPYYPAAVRITNLEDDHLFTLWHPGVLRIAQTGDRNADGRLDLYLGGTSNFLTPPTSNTSAPVAIAVETDWSRRDVEVSLFGPDRSLAATVPPGIELHYLSWPRVNLDGYHNAWQYALVQKPRTDQGEVYLSVKASQDANRKSAATTGIRWGLRDIFLDRSLSPVLAQWEPSIAEALGIDPIDPAMQALLETRYWNGERWQSTPTPVRRRP